MDTRVRIGDLLALVLGSALTRLLLYAGHTGLHSYDAGNLLLGALRYDISADQPHLPGYPLFTWLVSMLPWDVLLNAHLLIVVAAGLSAACTYGALTVSLGRRTALLTTTLLMVLPYVWYYTSVVETYTFDLLFASAIVWAGSRARSVRVLPLLLALAGGFRPTTMLFLAPLTALLLWRQREQLRGIRIIESLSLGVLAVAAWFIPMIQHAGGLDRYLSLYATNSPLPERSFVQNMEGLILHLPYFVAPLLIVRLFGRRDGHTNVSADPGILIAWLVPAVTSVVFMHYAKGYLLVIAVPVILIILQPWRRSYRLSAWFAGIVVAVALFWAMPAHPADPRTVMRHDQRDLAAWQVSLDRLFSVYSLSWSSYALQEALIEAERIAAPWALQYERSVVLVDPTCVVRPRAMQIMEPEQWYASLRTDTTHAVWMYGGGRVVGRRPASEAFASCLVITQERFARDVLGTRVEILSQEGPWAICRPRETASLERIYDSLFVRVR